MKLRRTAAAAAVALTSALVLTACGSGETPEGDAVELAGTTVWVDTAEEGEPGIALDGALNATDIDVVTIEEGTGDELTEGNLAAVHYVLLLGDGTRTGSTWVEGGGEPEDMEVGGLTIDILNAMLEGQRVGARVLAAGPITGVPEATDGTSTWVVYAEITDQRPDDRLTRAEGEAVTPDPALPTVTLDPATGAPTLGPVSEEFQDVTEMTVQTLIRGNGPEVQPGATVTIHYTGWTPDGEIFDSSWERDQPGSWPLGSLIQGWQQGIPGQTVGSQVMLIIPPSLAYGDSPDAHPLGGQTLIFVIDILDAF